jgi:hypothetical protein
VELDGHGLALPPYVLTPEQRERWDLAVETACAVLGEAPASAAVWSTARAIYWGPIPTHPEGDGANQESDGSLS